MKTRLIIDCETSGLFPKPGQPGPEPRIVQLGALLLDEEWRSQGELCLLIDNGAKIHPKAEEVHGISEEMCRNFGVIEVDAVRLLAYWICPQCEVGIYNFDFDSRLLTSAFEKEFGPPGIRWDLLDTECVMKLATPVCKIPFPNQRRFSHHGNARQWKWPRLEEAYSILTGKQVKGAHNALADCRMTAEVWQALISPPTFESQEREGER